ncbi:cupin domain-containing protein [Bradyrhizobium quebecense]|nr:cupin domain-containing protein [Bradyrhizobium quebecense]UGA46574.1 cupin domain-containing protein [Bradyrhizobium quebecense]
MTPRAFGITAGIAVAIAGPTTGAMDMPTNPDPSRKDNMVSPRILGPQDGHLAILGGTSARFMIEEDDAGGRFALVEHPMQPRALAAPMHRHHHEDEYSFVLEGRIGALLGDTVAIGNPGDLIFKPREQWHTFWNAGDTPARVLEIISPAGFENYFRELGAELSNGPPDPQRLATLCARYALDMDMSSVPGLIQRFGVRFPGEPSPAPQ